MSVILLLFWEIQMLVRYRSLEIRRRSKYWSLPPHLSDQVPVFPDTARGTSEPRVTGRRGAPGRLSIAPVQRLSVLCYSKGCLGAEIASDSHSRKTAEEADSSPRFFQTLTKTVNINENVFFE